MTELLLSAVRARADREPCRKELTRQQHSRIVKVAEDHALARAYHACFGELPSRTLRRQRASLQARGDSPSASDSR